MNITLPTERDLPPGSYERIREELRRARDGDQRREAGWLRPVVATTASAAAVVVVGGVVAGLQQGGDVQPAAPPRTTPTPVTTTLTTAKPPALRVPEKEREAIERGCVEAGSIRPGNYTLYNLASDQGGQFALLYNRHDQVMYCTIGDFPGSDYNPSSFGFVDPDQPPKTIDVDIAGASPGSDYPGSGAHFGVHGEETVAGRISSDVTRVTYHKDGRIVQAFLADGTFVARILYPSTWDTPDDFQLGVVKAYGHNGELLATVDLKEK